MKDILTKALKEIARIVCAALLAALGIEATGCVNCDPGQAALICVKGCSAE